MNTKPTRNKRNHIRPMVPTTDTIECPSSGVIKVHSVNPNDELCQMPTEEDYKKDKRKAEIQAAFVRDGLCPEERLLRAIFGESPEGLPPHLRTKGEFETQYKETLKQLRKIDREEAYIHGNHKFVYINEKDAAKAQKLIKNGATVKEAAKQLGLDAYSLKFRLSDDYDKPQILIVGEKMKREAEKTGDKKLMKKALAKIKEGEKFQKIREETDKEIAAERKVVEDRVRKICKENGIKRTYDFDSDANTIPAFRKLAAAGKMKPGARFITVKDEYLPDFKEYLYTGKKFVKIHEFTSGRGDD